MTKKKLIEILKKSDIVLIKEKDGLEIAEEISIDRLRYILAFIKSNSDYFTKY